MTYCYGHLDALLYSTRGCVEYIHQSLRGPGGYRVASLMLCSGPTWCSDEGGKERSGHAHPPPSSYPRTTSLGTFCSTSSSSPSPRHFTSSTCAIFCKFSHDFSRVSIRVPLHCGNLPPLPPPRASEFAAPCAQSGRFRVTMDAAPRSTLATHLQLSWHRTNDQEYHRPQEPHPIGL